jgi:RNA polymerase sigma factor (sigma-70 family)
MARLTTDELRALREQQDWKGLWFAAILWVKYAAAEVRGEDREDMIQAALLKVGRAIPKWNPNDSEFSTFINTVARNEMLEFQRKKRFRDEHARVLDNEADVEGTDGSVYGAPQATYQDMSHVPAGFASPAEELARLFAVDTAEWFLGQVDNLTSIAMRELFGLPVLEEPGTETTITKMAAARGVRQQRMSERLAAAQKFIGEQLEQQYMGNTESIYPPEGRVPWVTHRPAPSSFWSGLTSVMGDTDAWRDSTGSVWGDWSWKPTDADILRGAKK